MKYLALLRGINVGGKNVIKMSDLKQLFENLRFCDVKTYIQSGNVIFSTDNSNILDLQQTIEQQLFAYFAEEIKVAVFLAEQVNEIVTDAPEQFGAEPDKYRYDVWFVLPPTTPAEIVSAVQIREGVDTVHVGKHAVYTTRLTAEASRSRLVKIIQLPVFKQITIRNWNTTRKLAEILTASKIE